MEYVVRLHGYIQVFWSENLDHNVIKQDKTCSENTCAVCTDQYGIVCGIHIHKFRVWLLVFSWIG
jgi:hypothetical protein